MLLQLHDRLNLESSIEASFWAICLVAFYGMFRKSHLLPKSPTSFDPRKQLTKADFKVFPRGVLTNIHWSNTIQYRGRVEILLPCIPRSPFFPTAAIVNALHFTASGSNRCSQAFNWSDDRQLVHGFSQDEIICFRISETWRKHATPCFRYVYVKVVRFRCIRSNGNARKRHETGNGNTGYPSCFRNGLTCFCHVSVYGFLRFRPVFPVDLLLPLCAIILHRSVLTLSFSRGTPFPGVEHHLLTNAVFPLNCLRLSANGIPTPFSSI